MTTWDEYLKGILKKIVESHSNLLQMDDVPGDLFLIEKELLKITGFFNVIVTKLESEHSKSQVLLTLKADLKYYLTTYYFQQEIETLSTLYSQDSSRIRNIRLKILESFEDKKLMNKILNTIEVL